MLGLPAAWNGLELRHGASQSRQSPGALPLNQRLERFAQKRGLFFHTSKFLGNAHEFVVESNGGSHGIDYSIK